MKIDLLTRLAIAGTALWISATIAHAVPITVSLVGNRPLKVLFESTKAPVCGKVLNQELEMHPGKEYTIEGCFYIPPKSTLSVGPWTKYRIAYALPRPLKPGEVASPRAEAEPAELFGMVCGGDGHPRLTRCWVIDRIEKWEDGLMVPIAIRGGRQFKDVIGQNLELKEGLPSKACPAREWKVPFPADGRIALIMACYQQNTWSNHHFLDEPFSNPRRDKPSPFFVRNPFSDTWYKVVCCKSKHPYDLESPIDRYIPTTTEQKKLDQEADRKAEEREQRREEARVRREQRMQNAQQQPGQSAPGNRARCIVGIGGLQDKCGPLGTHHFVTNLGPQNVSGQVQKSCRSGTSSPTTQSVSFSLGGGQKSIVGCSQYDTYPFPTYCQYSLISCN